MYNLVLAVPQLQGFVAIIQVILTVVKVAFPLVDVVTRDPGDKSGATTVDAKDVIDAKLSEQDIVRAKNAALLMAEVAVKLAEEKKVEVKDVSWTADFFEEYKK